ncbi:MAG: condensation domain-containing protein, partial [Anaerolineae bacterium]
MLQQMNGEAIVDFYPLTPMQQGMLFHSLADPGTGVYHEQTTASFHGDLNVGVFRKAWQAIVERHSVLRTLFVGSGLREPIQAVRRHVDVPLRELDWQGQSEAEQAASLERLLDQDRAAAFDLGQAPLMRLYLMHLRQDRHAILWSHHHILLDGWSLPILLSEVATYYQA